MFSRPFLAGPVYLDAMLPWLIQLAADPMPNVVSYNTTISACADGEGMWDLGCETLQ